VRTLVRPSRPRLDALAGPAGRTAYLAGVGGVGMRGLATFLLENDWEVWGADRKPPGLGDPLLLAGLRLIEEGAPPPPVSLAVRSAAVPAAQAGLRAACAAGARPLRYAEVLGEISRLRPVLAVAGSHGKTTCTGWIAYGLRKSGIDAGYLVGANVTQLGGSAAWGDPAAPLVLESCEYERGFFHLSPAAVALTNVDAEHPDTYPGGLPEVQAAFREFLGRVQPADRGGQVFASPEAPDFAASTRAEWVAAEALEPGVQVGLHGAHNRRNAALVGAVLRGLGLDELQVGGALLGYRGAARRMEVLGHCRGARVVSDYAHHPAEIAATLQAAQERWPQQRILAIFQPHQAQRFRAYRDRFAASLQGVDALLLLEIHRARDPEDLQPSVVELLPLLASAPGQPVHPAANFDEAEEWVRAWVRPGDVVLCMGAGSVDELARRLAG